MRTYLATLHKRSPHHKRRFALLASGSFTLIIFAIWAAVNLGGTEATPASANYATREVNPFGTLFRGFSSLFGDSKDELKEGLQMIDLDSGFEEMRNNTLNSYGQ